MTDPKIAPVGPGTKMLDRLPPHDELQAHLTEAAGILSRVGGALDQDATRADVARLLGVHRSTITKDMAELDRALALYHDLAAQQGWLRRFYTTSQAAEALGLPERIVRDMAGAGVIETTRPGRGGAHRIAVEEVNRWAAFLARRPG